MRHLALILLLAAGCADKASSTTNEPVLTGNTCQVHTDATTCDADADCTWLGTGCACPANDPSCSCPPGACESKNGGSGSGSGSASTTAACACPNGEVCYEQIGGPATSTAPTIECILPAPGSGDPCPRIQGEGTCTDSMTVSGLCICDNGIR